jgi:hypothetical protein
MAIHFTREMSLGAAACAAFAAGAAFAQVSPPSPQTAASPPAYGASAASVADGRISRFVLNPNGDVDGLLLADGTQINFPPHLSQTLLQITEVGDTVSVQGVRGYGAGATIHATSITNTGTGRSVIDEPPAPGAVPASPAALRPLSANARVSRVLYAERGEMNGAILEDGTIVRFPPPIGVQLQNRLRPQAQLSASGYGTENARGRVLEATSLSIDGQVAVDGPGTEPAPPPEAGQR